MSSTYTDKSSPFSRLTNEHSQNLFSNCLSHDSPARGWPYRFRSRGTTESSILDHGLGRLCFGGRLRISGHSGVGIFNDEWASPILTWVLVLRILVALTWHPLLLQTSFVTQMYLALETLRKSLNHLLQCLTSEYNSAFVFLTFWFQLRILEMTDVHLRRKMNFSALSPCFINHLFFCFWPLSSCYAGIFSSFSHDFSTAAFASGIFIASGIGINLCTRFLWFSEILFPLPAIWSSWALWRGPSIRFLADSSASTMHACFVSRLSKTLQVSLYSSRLVLQGIAAGIGSSNFLRAFFHNVLEFFIRWINEVNTTHLPNIAKLRFFDSSLLLFSSLRRYLACLFHISHHK